MNSDIDDEFSDAPVESKKTATSSRAGDSGMDEFPDEPTPVGHAEQYPDESDEDAHLLFPDGWDTKMGYNALDDNDDRVPRISEEASNLSQEMFYQFDKINKRIERLYFAKDKLRRKFIKSLEAGCDVEPGLLELKHDKRKVKGKSFQDIASVLGETATAQLFESLPEYERDFISVREAKPKRSKKTK